MLFTLQVGYIWLIPTGSLLGHGGDPWTFFLTSPVMINETGRWTIRPSGSQCFEHRHDCPEHTDPLISKDVALGEMRTNHSLSSSPPNWNRCALQRSSLFDRILIRGANNIHGWGKGNQVHTIQRRFACSPNCLGDDPFLYLKRNTDGECISTIN
jgi:hypothetical protein